MGIYSSWEEHNKNIDRDNRNESIMACIAASLLFVAFTLWIVRL